MGVPVSPFSTATCGPAGLSWSSAPVTSKPATLDSAAASQSEIRRVLGSSPQLEPIRSNMLSTLVSDSNDLASLFTGDEHKQMSRYPARPNTGTTSNSGAMSPTSTELSDDSSLTNDDLVVLSDLFGFVTPGSHSSQVTSRPRTRKRPRVTKAPSEDGSALPKSQQQRQKQEIEFLKKQVVELQTTIEELHARKLKREHRARKLAQCKDHYNASPVNEWGISERQVAAVQQLEEQNVKLHSQVAAHVSQLQQLEQIARSRYLGNAYPEPKQLEDHSNATYYATC